ncbi:hypothetical protein Tco_1100983 [Tanacetum coccineum]
MSHRSRCLVVDYDHLQLDGLWCCEVGGGVVGVIGGVGVVCGDRCMITGINGLFVGVIFGVVCGVFCEESRYGIGPEDTKRRCQDYHLKIGQGTGIHDDVGRRLRRQRVKGIDHPCCHNEEGFDGCNKNISKVEETIWIGDLYMTRVGDRERIGEGGNLIKKN